MHRAPTNFIGPPDSRRPEAVLRPVISPIPDLRPLSFAFFILHIAFSFPHLRPLTTVVSFSATCNCYCFSRFTSHFSRLTVFSAI